MSAVSSLDADAFMRKYLQQPSDATARLVFADWLEEQGEPHNRAWAYYIRLKAETDRYPNDSAQRYELDRQAGEYAVHIQARLTIPAKLFVGYPKSLLQLLPAPYLTVSLSRYTVPRDALELVPESVARENLVIPLAVQDRVLLLAAAEPTSLTSYDTAQKLQFILNRDVVQVGAGAADVRRAINRHYGETETETVDSVLVEFADTAGPWTYSPPFTSHPFDSDDAPVARLVNLIILEAINHHADRILLAPMPDALAVRNRIGGAWVERDQPPRRLLRPVFTRIAIMAGIDIALVHREAPPHLPLVGDFVFTVQSAHFDVHVTVQPSPDGPTAELAISPA